MSFEKSILELSENFKNHNFYRENYEHLESLPIVRQLREENKRLMDENKKLTLFIVKSIVKSEEHNLEGFFGDLIEKNVHDELDGMSTSAMATAPLNHTCNCKISKKRPSLRKKKSVPSSCEFVDVKSEFESKKSESVEIHNAESENNRDEEDEVVIVENDEKYEERDVDEIEIESDLDSGEVPVEPKPTEVEDEEQERGVADLEAAEEVADLEAAEEVADLEAAEEEEVAEEEEEDEVIEKYFNNKKYYITNENNGIVYDVDENDEPGNEVGQITNGKIVLY